MTGGSKDCLKVLSTDDSNFKYVELIQDTVEPFYSHILLLLISTKAVPNQDWHFNIYLQTTGQVYYCGRAADSDQIGAQTVFNRKQFIVVIK